MEIGLATNSIQCYNHLCAFSLISYSSWNSVKIWFYIFGVAIKVCHLYILQERTWCFQSEGKGKARKTMYVTIYGWDLEMTCLFCLHSIVWNPVTRHIQLCGKEGNSVYVPKKKRKLLAVPSTQVRTMCTMVLSC